MTSIFSYIFYQNCATMLFEYDGGTPFHLYVKACFKENKNWGSKDRKRYRTACYFFWRNSFGVSRQSPEIILHWLQTNFTPVLGDLQLNFPSSKSTSPKQQSETIINPYTTNNSDNPESNKNYSPYQSLSQYLSQTITTEILTPWFTSEPLVWLSNGNISLKGLQTQLTKAGIAIEQTQGNAIAVSAQVNLNPWVENGNAYIQDISSQTAMDWSNQPMAVYCHANTAVWDCCAGAGGKSISLLKQFPTTNLTCSDVRSNILENLKQRFQLLGLKQPTVFTASLNGYLDNSNSKNPNQTYHVILADVPCTGSGTWRRNPENIHFFDSTTIKTFAEKQFTIIQNVLPSLAIGGYLVYLTCSVFAAENENTIQQLLDNHDNLQLISQEFCGGIDIHGDFIYRCIIQKVN
ncbi:tRNA/rRNA cytosine-C5-methylase RsmB [Bacteroidota bacterium]|nr:tRNA/rRNA cytosine-C5-methylase RsmB [Bacteroidota bacterium]